MKQIHVLLATLIIASLVTTVAVFTEYYPRPKKEAPQNQTSDQIQTIVSPNAFFYTKVFLERDQTFVSFPYKAEPDPEFLWLFLIMQDGTPHTRLLVSHPVISQLDWSSVTDGFVTLYQKTPQYDSVEEFIKSPPKNSKNQILMDSYLTKIGPYQQVAGIEIPERIPDLDLSGVQYILTTYHAPRQQDGFNYYETTLDASNALVNDRQELVWQILAPLVTETHPLTIGTIHVDYRQL